MRPRLVVLLLLLVGCLVGAWVVRQRRSEATALREMMAEAAARYMALEAAATFQEQTTWAPTQNLHAADQWCAAVADRVMADPQRWPAWHAFLLAWPALKGLQELSESYPRGGWQLERVTAKPLATVPAVTPEAADYLWELLLSRDQERAVLQAQVTLHWDTNPTLDAFQPSRLSLGPTTRQEATAAFRAVAEFTLSIPTNTAFADPLLYQETPAGPELILVSARQRFQWRRPLSSPSKDGWQPGPNLTGIPADRAVAAALADFNGDGWSDLWLGAREGLWIALGDARGDFAAPVLVWRSPAPLIYPECLAIGDFDHDGDLDVWLTQYKNPYQKGQFPTPYHDANDGFPSFLLRNDGAAGFRDVTESSGLATLRRRRTYSASWLDFDGDGAPDLINVSDFAGLDVYRNLGAGQFTNLTAALGDSRHAFGMAHLVVNRNGDAWPDLLMVGMDSAWAARLDVLRLGRTDFPRYSVQRAAMTAGNRVFLGSSTGLRPELSPGASSLARAGWAWGVAELDVENDGRPDYFFATGHETRASQRDYERQFWLHDLYSAGSTNDRAAELYFRAAGSRRVGEQASYGGWQHQALLRADSSGNYREASWVSGVGLLADGRNALAADFDGDGRVDLAVTTFEGWPQVRQRLVIYRNETPNAGHWIGVRFPSGAGRKSGVNARVEIQTGAGIRRRWLVTGDGYRSQQTVQAHFGLGAETNVQSATVFWSDGTQSILTAPAVDRWYAVQ